MFKRISYMCMLASVLLSWGFMVSFARSADGAKNAGVQAATAESARIVVGDYSPRQYLNDKISEANAVVAEAKLRRAVAATSTRVRK